MFYSFLPHAMRGAGAVALCLTLGGLALPLPAQALPLPTTGCYDPLDGEIYPEGNVYFALGHNSCVAPTAPASVGDRWDTMGFVGLSFSTGEGFTPHLAAGIRHTNVNAAHFVYGGEINASVSLVKGFEDAQVRLLGIAGKADALGVGLLGNAGIGWDLGANSLLLNAGLQVPYARFFIDYTIDDNSLRAFLEANSYGKIDAIQRTATCGAGTVLADGAEILQQWGTSIGATSIAGDIFDGSFDWFGLEEFSGVPSDAFVGGQTCYQMGGLIG
jgi:opacity protein-like surface antigen